MSAVEGNDEEVTANKCDADGDGFAAGPTGSVSMPANCVVSVEYEFYFIKMIRKHRWLLSLSSSSSLQVHYHYHGKSVCSQHRVPKGLDHRGLAGTQPH